MDSNDAVKINELYQKYHKNATIVELFGKQRVLELTDFLPVSSSWGERIYCIKNNIKSSPSCPVCGKGTKFISIVKGYRKFCSKKCSNNSSDTKNAFKQTMVSRYGVEHSSQSETLKFKAELTNLERYGHKSPLSSLSVQNKRAQTCYNKYGTTNVSSLPEIKQKVKQTMVEKFGVSNFKHLHLSNDAVKKLSDANWLEEQHHLHNKSLATIADELGVTLTAVVNRFKQFSISVNKYGKISKPQQQLINFLTNDLQLEIEVNNTTILSNQEIDIVIPQFKLCIEVNGVYWHSEQQGKHRSYHLDKTKECNKRGYKLIHILDYEIINKYEIVKSRLAHMCCQSQRVYARNTSVREISKREAALFLERTHIQGSSNASTHHYGLFNSERLVAVMTFGASRFNSNYQYELLRFSTELNMAIVGGANKLIKAFQRTYNFPSIISYADRRWSNGGVYSKIGFTLIRTSRPNYWYFNVINPTTKIYSRVNFQKHKLKTKLAVYDETLSEYQNMKRNGYDRIWDCGNYVFVIA